MKTMWMLLFMLLPLAGIAYVSWHVWMLLPLPAIWRGTAIILLIASFLLLFLDLGGQLDRLPLLMARVCYEIGTSSIMILLYLVMIFLLLDMGRLVGLVPRSFNSYNPTKICERSPAVISYYEKRILWSREPGF